MIVEGGEVGTRPKLWTKQRLFAPQAVQALTQHLSTKEFADKGFIVLDWSDELKQQPADAAYPVIYMQVVKDVPGHGQLRAEVRFDVDDIFGKDSMTPSILVDMVKVLEDAVADEIAKKTRG